MADTSARRRDRSIEKLKCAALHLIAEQGYSNTSLEEVAHAAGFTKPYWDWVLDRAWVLVPAQMYVANMVGTFLEVPPRQEPASFNLDNVLTKLQSGVSSA